MANEYVKGNKLALAALVERLGLDGFIELTRTLGNEIQISGDSKDVSQLISEGKNHNIIRS